MLLVDEFIGSQQRLKMLQLLFTILFVTTGFGFDPMNTFKDGMSQPALKEMLDMMGIGDCMECMWEMYQAGQADVQANKVGRQQPQQPQPQQPPAGGWPAPGMAVPAA